MYVPAYDDPDTTYIDIENLIKNIKNSVAKCRSFFSEKYPVFEKNT